MKRSLIIGLVLVLLLTGCVSAPGGVTASPGPSASSGGGVYTDWSKLEPKEQTHSPVYTRRQEGWSDRLIPADDYGTLYAFAGERVPATQWYGGMLEEEKKETTLYKYGLVTGDGQVVVDPVYDLVGTPCDRAQDGPSFYHSMPPVLLLGILVEPEPEDETMAWQWRYGAAAEDGSWATEVIYTHYYAADENTLLLWEQTGEIVVVDVSGTVRFTIPAGEGSWIPQMETWSEGMVLGNDGQHTWFYDGQTGAKRLGPYAYAQPFSEGLAAVQAEEDGLWGYIDKTGAWAIAPMFEWGDSFSGGVALVRVIGGLPALAAPDGQFYMEANEGELVGLGEADQRWYLHYTREEETNQVRVLGAYGSGGARLEQPAAGEELTLWWESAASCVREEETIYYQNGQVYTLPLPGTVREAAGDYVILQKVLSEREYQYALLTLEGELLIDYSPNVSLSFFVPAETGRAVLNVSGEENGEYTHASYELDPAEAALTYLQEDWGCGYQDRAGKWVFRWPWMEWED